MTNYKFFILTGDPGVGKTTLTKKISSVIAANGIRTSGFITEEVRRNGQRQGFDVVTLDGLRGRLARDQTFFNDSVKFRVGKYGVLVHEFEKVALPSLSDTEVPQSLLVIDEIGKMEFFSELFKNRVKALFSEASKCMVLATIPVRKSDNLIESIRNHSKAKVWMVTRVNRDNIHEDIVKDIITTLNMN